MRRSTTPKRSRTASSWWVLPIACTNEGRGAPLAMGVQRWWAQELATRGGLHPRAPEVCCPDGTLHVFPVRVEAIGVVGRGAMAHVADRFGNVSAQEHQAILVGMRQAEADVGFAEAPHLLQRIRHRLVDLVDRADQMVRE